MPRELNIGYNNTCIEKFEDGDCQNKAYSKNHIAPSRYYWVCRKHHDLYNRGVIRGHQKVEK